MGKGGKPGGGRGTLVPFPSGAGNDIELKRADGVDVTLKLPSGEKSKFGNNLKLTNANSLRSDPARKQ